MGQLMQEKLAGHYTTKVVPKGSFPYVNPETRDLVNCEKGEKMGLLIYCDCIVRTEKLRSRVTPRSI